MIKCIKIKFTVVEGKISKLSLTSVLMPGGEYKVLSNPDLN